jgi:hypothetical protein
MTTRTLGEAIAAALNTPTPRQIDGDARGGA